MVGPPCAHHRARREEVRRQLTSTDIPETVDLRWIARQLIALQNDIASLRDDMPATTAALNRLDDNTRRLNGNMSLVVTELRAMRSALGECQIFCVRGFRDG